MQEKNKLSNSDLKFIKSYYKPSYNKESVKNAENFDCEKRQAPLKTFIKAERKDYKFSKHCKVIRNNLPSEKAGDLISEVMDINAFTEAKANC